jgi:hypothetical protein
MHDDRFERRIRAMTTSDTDVLQRLAGDLQLAAWLLPTDDELRGHLELLGALPPTLEAWDDVLRPWLHAMRAGAAPAFESAPRLAAAGAMALATARAAQELDEHESLGVALRCMARWCARSVGAPTAS